MSDMFRAMQLESPFLKGESFEAPARVASGPFIVVEHEKDRPLTVGEYTFHQGDTVERGWLDGNGRASLGRIDPKKPFVFAVRDRVCAIRAGAFLDPDDPALQYGGTQFDWTLVRDNKNPDKTFWPFYQREMDFLAELEAFATPHNRRVERFLQHEHITRQPIRIAAPFLSQLSGVRIRATPVQIRIGPFVRYTDHERAVIWLETVTPAMVRVRCRRHGDAALTIRYASTVRVGGRHFAAVEVDGLRPETFYDYTLELAPLPAAGPIPLAQQDFVAAFPALTTLVSVAAKRQCTAAAIHDHEWLAFRTLRRTYDRRIRFATGSCRWFPGDTQEGKKWGPDMLEGLGNWLRVTSKAEWPHFQFFGGDQIYSDEIGDNHGDMLANGRFASRVPGPVDPAKSTRQKLVDGAWAGRFAHRYMAYTDPALARVQTVTSMIKQLDDIHARYPDINGIYREYPDDDPREKLRWRYRLLKNKRQGKLETDDEKKAREAVALLPKVEGLERAAEPFRALLRHWKSGFDLGLRRNPMTARFLIYNFLLWKIPDFERQLPTIGARGSATLVLKPDRRGHPSADRGVHAADFAEYAYLYERAWTGPRSVRIVLAHVPTFLMFDDHEATDDWNFDTSWARMLHNAKDDFRLWPKTLTDALAAYWVYQGWGNKAPSQWKVSDPRVKALADAARDGTDALPQLRRAIHDACFTPAPPQDPRASYQAGLRLDWHYKLPFDPPFLVPDCRTRRLMVPSDEALREIAHDPPANMPKSQTIDDAQLAWLREHLERWRGGPVAFIAPSTPLLMQKKVMAFMRMPAIAAGAWARGADVMSLSAAVFDSQKPTSVTNALSRVFRLGKDLEHMIRDKSWRDLWGIAERLRQIASPIKTLVLVSGDVHHSYAMTGHLPGAGRPTPELVQITCSGLQTTIRSDKEKKLAEVLSSTVFTLGKYRQVPGFTTTSDTATPDLVLYKNTVALVDASLGSDVNLEVTYLAGSEKNVYRYTSGPAYLGKSGMPAVYERYRLGTPAPAGKAR